MGSLEEDMLRMLGNAVFCDMVFVCGAEDEEQEVPALRMLVAARSPALESMLLTSGMAETKLSRIPLPEMEASIMRICLEFFYTGTVRDHSWMGFFTSMKVIAASRFFLVSKLEQLAISHLSSYLEKVGHEKALFVDIAKAYTYGVNKLLQEDHSNTKMHSLMLQLNNSIVFSAHLCLECYKHLSEQAFIHLVENLNLARFSMHQYGVFHLLVQWCASQLVLPSDDPYSIDEQVVENTIRQTLPWRADDVHKRASMTTDHNNEPHVHLSICKVMKLLADPVASCLKKLNVNFSSIPTLALSNIIEPLGIVPCSMLLTAYKSQALTRPDMKGTT